MPDDFTVVARSAARLTAYLDDLDFDAKFNAGKKRWSLDKNQSEFIETIYNAPVNAGRQILSNRHVRRAGLHALIDVMLWLEEELDDYPCYFVTFCWDEGLTWEDRPYVSYSVMQMRVYHALRSLGLVGFQVMEFDTVRPLHDGPRQRQHHAHCVVWKPGRKFKPRKAAKTLRQDVRSPTT